MAAIILGRKLEFWSEAEVGCTLVLHTSHSNVTKLETMPDGRRYLRIIKVEQSGTTAKFITWSSGAKVHYRLSDRPANATLYAPQILIYEEELWFDLVKDPSVCKQ